MLSIRMRGDAIAYDQVVGELIDSLLDGGYAIDASPSPDNPSSSSFVRSDQQLRPTRSVISQMELATDFMADFINNDNEIWIDYLSWAFVDSPEETSSSIEHTPQVVREFRANVVPIRSNRLTREVRVELIDGGEIAEIVHASWSRNGGGGGGDGGGGEIVEISWGCDGGKLWRERGMYGLVKEGSLDGRLKKDGEIDDCCICLEKQSGVGNLIVLPCSHIFHHECIFTWLEKQENCPMCRQKAFHT